MYFDSVVRLILWNLGELKMISNWLLEISPGFVDWLFTTSKVTFLTNLTWFLPYATLDCCKGPVPTDTITLGFSQNNSICLFEPGSHRCLMLLMYYNRGWLRNLAIHLWASLVYSPGVSRSVMFSLCSTQLTVNECLLQDGHDSGNKKACKMDSDWS